MNTELKYGFAESYSYNLDKDRLTYLVSKTNRSESQTQFLFNLVDGDFEKLKKLECQLKNNFVFYCPADKQELDKVMT